MRKILFVLALAGVFMACGNRGESAAGSDTTTVRSTTPTPTLDTLSPIGVMMGDTTINEYDSVNGGQD